MGKSTTPKKDFKVKKVKRFRWAKWNAPLVLLILAFTFMMATLLSSASKSGPASGGFLPYVLVALLCTLVAVSAALIGRASKQTEDYIQSAASEATSCREELLRAGQASLMSNDRAVKKISRLEENQQQLLGKLTELKKISHLEGNQRLLLDKLAELKNVTESKRDSLGKATQACMHEVAKSTAAVTSSNQTMQTRMDGLLLAVKLMSGKISTAVDNQESLRGVVQEHGGLLDGRMSDLAEEHQELRARIDGLCELIQTVAGDVSDVAREQANLNETVEVRGEESVRRIDNLSEDHTNVCNHLDRLGENIKQVSAETVEQVIRQVASRESFQAQVQVFDARLSGLAEAQKQLRDHVDGLLELMQVVAGDVRNVTREHASLHEAVENRGRDSTRRLEALSEDQRAVQNRVEQLGETVKQVSAEAVELISGRVANHESFQAHAKTLDAQLSGLADAQEQLHGHVGGLRELMRSVAGDVTNVAREQETLHEAVETLSKDHENVRNDLEQLGQNVEHFSAEAVEQVTQRVVSRKSFQAQAEALGVKLSGLAAAQEQLHGHVGELRELIQAVAGDVTNVAREQETLHAAVETRGAESIRQMETLSKEFDGRLEALSEESTGRLEALSQDHAHVHNHLDQLGENVKRASCEAAEQVAQRVASRESFQAHAEMLDLQLAGLATAQEQLRSHVCGLRDIVQGVVGDVTNVARGQAALHEAVETRGRDSAHRFETLSEDHRSVQRHVDQLGETVRQVTTDAVKLVAMRVASRESFEAHTEALDTQLSGLAAAQDQMRGHVFSLKGILQTVAANVTDVAHKQVNLHETVEARGEESARHIEALSEESVRRLESLSEDHKKVHKHLDRLGEDVKQASAEAFETLSEESVRRLESLSKDHRNVHNHLDRLGEDVKQAGSDALETLARQVTSCESFEAHTEALEAQFSGLASAQEQLRGHIANLRELVQAVAGDVSNVAREQVNLQEAVEAKGEESVRHMDALSQELDHRLETIWAESVGHFETLSEDHASVHIHLDQLGEDVRQAAETLSEESVRHREVLSQDHRNVHGHLDQLGEDVKQAAERLSEESVRHREELSEDHRNVHGHLDQLGEDVKQAAERISEESVRHREELSEDHRNVHGHLDQLGEDVKQATERLSEESVRHREELSGDHRNVYSRLDQLGEDVKQAAERLSEESARHRGELSEDHRNVHGHLDSLGEDVRQTALELSEESTRHRAALSQDHGNLRNRLDQLGEDVKQATETLSQESARHREALSQDHKGMHNHLDRLGEDVKQTTEALSQESARHREALSQDHKNVHNHLDRLGEDVKQATETLSQESARHREALSEDHKNIHNHLDRLGEDVKQNAEALSEKSVRHLEALAEDHKNVHSHLDCLGKDVRLTSAETVDQVTQYVASHESFQAHAEALDAQLSGLAAAQEQLRGHVNGLSGLIQAVAGDVTNVAREQATLHEAVEARGEESIRRLETLSAGQKSTHVQLDHLGENIRKVSAEAVEMFAGRVASRESFQAHVETLDAQLSGLAATQEQLRSRVDSLREAMQAAASDLHEAVETRGEESARRLETLSEDHRAVQSHLEQLEETVKHVSAEAVELVTRQVATGESLQEAHAEALDAQLGGLAAAQEQLRGHVDGLRELMQAVAGDVTSVAREQANLHKTVEARGQDSVRRFETLSEDHADIHKHLEHVGENVKQANAEALKAQMSGLMAAQERLENNVNEARVNLEKISAEQVSLNGAVQDSTSTAAATIDRIEQLQRTLQGEIGNLAQASERTIASMEEMSAEQAALRVVTASKNEELAGQIAAFSEDQRAALSALGEDLQKATKDMASVARDQDRIESAVSGTCQESLSKLDALTDDQEHLGRQMEANKAQVNEMLTNIGTVQQQVAAVLEMLNTCVQSLTDVLESNNEQQSRLEGTINQNLTAIAELISQIQANRACLEKQM